MLQHPLQGGRRRAHRWITTQIGAVILAAAVTLLAAGPVAAYSVLVGGAASIVPNVYFVGRVFPRATGRTPRETLKDLCLGEAARLVGMGIFFVLALRFAHVVAAPLIAGVIAAQIAWMLAPVGTWIREHRV